MFEPEFKNRVPENVRFLDIHFWQFNLTLARLKQHLFFVFIYLSLPYRQLKIAVLVSYGIVIMVATCGQT